MENAKNDALSVEKVVYANIETKEVFAKSVEEMVYANIIDAEVRFAKSGWCGGSGSYMRANIINAEVIAKSVEEVVYANIIIFSSSTEILFEIKTRCIFTSLKKWNIKSPPATVLYAPTNSTNSVRYPNYSG